MAESNVVRQRAPVAVAGPQRPVAAAASRPVAVTNAASVVGGARLGPLVGRSPQMQELFALIRRASPTTATVLISGETGTGKELVAGILHTMGSRSRRPFVAVNCGAVSAHLAESEIFGHERGSFTGADRMHAGYFEQANGGTLFLDEVAECPLEQQVKLLRTLEGGELTRIGGAQPIAVDVRVVAGTNVCAAEAVAAGRLRPDLFYRLNVFPLHLPPLRERDGDAELLAEYFLARLNAVDGTSKEMSPGFRAAIRRYPWPGNVRELRNVMERAFILADRVIAAELGPVAAPRSHPVKGIGSSLADMERSFVLDTLDHCAGDRKRTAAVLDITPRALASRLTGYAAS